MHVPKGLGEYHSRLISFQAEAVRRMRPELLVYHLAQREYHMYISELEVQLGQQLPQVHQLLDEFVEDFRAAVMQALEPHVGSLRFIQPVEEFDVTDQVESYLYPYLHVEDFGVSPERVAAVEDLREVHLAHSAWQRCGTLVPVFAGVLDVPNHPFNRKELREGKYTTVEFTKRQAETQKVGCKGCCPAGKKKRVVV